MRRMRSVQECMQGSKVSVRHPCVYPRPLSGNPWLLDARTGVTHRAPARSRPRLPLSTQDHGHRHCPPALWAGGDWGHVEQPIRVATVRTFPSVRLAALRPHVIWTRAWPPLTEVRKIHTVRDGSIHRLEGDDMDPQLPLLRRLHVSIALAPPGRPCQAGSVRVGRLAGASSLRERIGQDEQGATERDPSRHATTQQQVGKGLDGPCIVHWSLPLAQIEMVSQGSSGVDAPDGLAIVPLNSQAIAPCEISRRGEL